MTEPETPGDLPGLVVMNPEAVGDLDVTPVVFVGNDLRALLGPCACGGVNGFHGDDCEAVNGT